MRHSILIGLRALRGNPLRTVLSTLGVIIGVGALVAVLAVGDGVERFAREEIARTTDLQTIVVAPRTTREVDGLPIPVQDYPTFGVDDAAAVKAALPWPAEVTVVAGGPALARGADTARRGVWVTGVAPAVPPGGGVVLRAGRFFSDAEARAGERVAVVPDSLARALGVAVGDSVELGAAHYVVIGLSGARAGLRRFEVYVPHAALAGAVTAASPARLLVRLERVEDVPAGRSAIERWLAGRWPDWRDRASVDTNELRVTQTRRAMLVFKLLMGAITGISLVVGGIGIMNVLLASVTERTREIGVRRAAGARRRDVLVQFLAESVAVTGVGSALGVLLGLGTAFGVTALMRARTEAPVRAAFTWSTLAVAAAAAIVIGLVFGIYPALRAARLAPIDAIRHE